ncbi:hypothetical protein Ddye_006747 [Dipteronia dyeriana]|uniref:Uncharacterized protein n=1 Tax=Dipteronia dyeriana TaxID=168575 RepID=A0AAD9XIT2_9ROSI|nr:hypothetical protein Ddye_006747 [Dipteronia dyeriana]
MLVERKPERGGIVCEPSLDQVQNYLKKDGAGVFNVDQGLFNVGQGQSLFQKVGSDGSSHDKGRSRRPFSQIVIYNEKGGVSVGVNVVGFSGYYGGKDDEVNILREAFRIGCLEKRDHDSESMRSNVVKDCNVVLRLGKGWMVEASGGRGVNSKIYVDDFDKNGEEFVLGGMEKGGTSFMESRVNKLGSSVIKGNDRLASLEDVESVSFVWCVCSVSWVSACLLLMAFVFVLLLPCLAF